MLFPPLFILLFLELIPVILDKNVKNKRNPHFTYRNNCFSM